MEELQFWDLLYLADKYLVSHLIRRVLKKILSFFSPAVKTNERISTKILKHFQRARENICGERLLPIIQKEIEKHSEMLILSEEFLSLRKEDVLEILKFRGLSVSEGQVFKAGVDWCINHYENKSDAEKQFQKHFQSLVKHENLTSKDFLSNVNPHSNFVDEELLKKITQDCFTKRSDQVNTRDEQNPIKKVTLRASDFSTSKKKIVLKFPHFSTTLMCERNSEENRLKIAMTISSHGVIQSSSYGRCMFVTTDVNGKVELISDVNKVKNSTFESILDDRRKFVFYVDTRESACFEMLRQTLTLEKTDNGQIICPSDSYSYTAQPITLSAFQTSWKIRCDRVVFPNDDDLRHWPRKEWLGSKPINLDMALDQFMSTSYLVPYINHLLLGIIQHPEYKTTSASNEKKKLWMIYIEDRIGKFTLKKNLYLDTANQFAIDDVLLDALNHAAGVERGSYNIEYGVVTTSSTIKTVEMVSGAELAAFGTGYFVFLSRVNRGDNSSDLR